MIITYETKESAIGAIPEFCEKMEQDVFVHRVKYPYGEEFSLRTRKEIMGEDMPSIVHKFYLPFDHEFAERDNAYREARIQEDRKRMSVTVERHYRWEKGYKIFSHYTLKV